MRQLAAADALVCSLVCIRAREWPLANHGFIASLRIVLSGVLQQLCEPSDVAEATFVNDKSWPFGDRLSLERTIVADPNRNSDDVRVPHFIHEI